MPYRQKSVPKYTFDGWNLEKGAREGYGESEYRVWIFHVPCGLHNSPEPILEATRVSGIEAGPPKAVQGREPQNGHTEGNERQPHRRWP